MSEHLHHKLAMLQQNLLHGKLPRSLQWADAVELVGHLGQVVPHGGGGEEFAFIVGAQRELFKRPRNAEFGIDEVSRLRKFLKSASADVPPLEAGQPTRAVVVIDHHAAHIFRTLSGRRPQDEVDIEPYDPHHYHHHLVHRHEAHYQGDRLPEESSFYGEVTDALVAADEIVLIGHGTGKSSAVDVLVEYLTKHRPDISRRVIATEIADLSALTDAGVAAIAERHMKAPAGAATG